MCVSEPFNFTLPDSKSNEDEKPAESNIIFYFRSDFVTTRKHNFSCVKTKRELRSPYDVAGQYFFRLSLFVFCPN